MLPEVESPIPETIGLDFIFSFAGYIGMLLFVSTTVLGRSEAERNKWSRRGMVAGFSVGALVYLLALAATVL